MGQGLMFIGLNVADVALTLKLAPIGGELNWYRLVLDSPVMFVALKVLLVGAVLYCLYRFGYRKILKKLNIGMSVVVCVNLVCLISYLIGRF